MKYSTTSINVYGAPEDPDNQINIETVNAKLDTEIQARTAADKQMSDTLSYITEHNIPYDDTRFITNISSDVKLSLGTIEENGVKKIVLLRDGIAGDKL